MPSDSDAINKRLTELFAEYRQQLPQRIAEIRQLLDSAAADTNRQESLVRLYDALHKLAGSGSTFGFTELSVVAREWEHAVHDCLHDPNAINEVLFLKMKQLCDKLSAAAPM